MNKDLEQAKALLENNEGIHLRCLPGGENFASEEHGVRPLMRWLNEERTLRRVGGRPHRRQGGGVFMYCWAFGRSTRRL